MNKKGKTEAKTVFIWIAVIAAVWFLVPGVQNTVGNLFGGSEPVVSDNCPTNGISTVSLIFKDELATSTNVKGNYYIFDGNSYVTDGTLDGSDEVELNCGGDYQMLAINTTAGNGYYGKVYTIKPKKATATVSGTLLKFGTAEISKFEGVTSESENITLAAGSNADFLLRFRVSSSDSAYNKPIIMCKANITTVDDVNGKSFSDGTAVKELASLPKRLSPGNGYTYYAWVYEDVLTSKDSEVSFTGNIVAASQDPEFANSGTFDCILIDQARYEAEQFNLKSDLAEAFPEGPEDKENSNTDVGAADTSTSSINLI